MMERGGKGKKICVEARYEEKPSWLGRRGDESSQHRWEVEEGLVWRSQLGQSSRGG